MKFAATVVTLAISGGLVAACNVAVDSPLGVRALQQTVKPGESVTGKVINPDGKITVGLQNFVTHEITTCIYSGGKKKFTCPTSTDAEGLYVVGVTDTAHPDDGTKKAPVAVTVIDDYAPQVSVQDKATEGEAVTVSLLMWGARRGVTVKVFQKGDKPLISRRVQTGGDGTGKTTLTGLKAGDYVLTISDGLWTIGRDSLDSKLLLTVTK
ncbi:MAG: hypothetical protein ABIR57_15435 [Aeromicrobium sp.]